MYKPAIIVVAFNRPASLQRLLNSIAKADYPDEWEVPLCLCIDYQESENNREVVRIAEEYSWPRGPKEIIHQAENLGLKKHVLACGDLSQRFDSIIMLEDDLFVSPTFYSYTVQALDYYREAEQIGGISLYNHRINFVNRRPFLPLEDGTDVYFLQIASSWGQAWTRSQWMSFRIWLKENSKVPANVAIPEYVINWPDQSWLKHFIHYLRENDKFFVYPRVGLSTNFGDTGQNNANNSTNFQVPIWVGVSPPVEVAFVPVSDSNAVYDSFFELSPKIFLKFNHSLSKYDFDVNLQGSKPANKLNKEFVIVSGKYHDGLRTFPVQMKPIELNVVFDLPGEGISLIAKKDLSKVVKKNIYERIKWFEYSFGFISLKEKINNLKDVVLEKLIGHG